MRNITRLFLLLPMLGGVWNVSAADEVPYYFPDGVVRATDPLHQMEEYLRYFQAMDQCTHPASQSRYMLGENDIRVETDVVSTSSYTKNPTRMTIVLDQHVRWKDGRVRVTSFCEQRFITEHQLQVVVDDLIRVVKKAADLNQAFYSEVINLAVESIAKTLEMNPADVLVQLERMVPGTDITFREYWFIPKKSRVSDFVPRELHLGTTPTFPPGVLGVTWLNTGLIYYNPMSRVLDYLIGSPSIMQHEGVHVNVNLQKFPFGDGIDLELVASIPEMLYPENTGDLFYHGYMVTVRQLVESYFSFPFAEIRDRIVKFDAGGTLVIDAEAYRNYFGQLEIIKRELMSAFKHVLSEYYSKQVWWMAFHRNMGNNDGVFKISMAALYDLTGLGGRTTTMRLLEMHKTEIFEAAKKAFLAQKESHGDAGLKTSAPQVLVDIYYKMFSPKQRTALEEYYRRHPDELQHLWHSPSGVWAILKMLFTNEQTIGGGQ